MCFDKRPPFRPHSHSRHRPALPIPASSHVPKSKYRTGNTTLYVVLLDSSVYTQYLPEVVDPTNTHCDTDREVITWDGVRVLRAVINSGVKRVAPVLLQPSVGGSGTAGERCECPHACIPQLLPCDCDSREVTATRPRRAGKANSTICSI